jgi:hypothetical protein
MNESTSDSGVWLNAHSALSPAEGIVGAPLWGEGRHDAWHRGAKPRPKRESAEPRKARFPARKRRKCAQMIKKMGGVAA